MCSRTTCRTCGKPTFRGCGAHIEEVLGDVAPADRCTCGVDGPPKTGRMSRLFGR